MMMMIKTIERMCVNLLRSGEDARSVGHFLQIESRVCAAAAAAAAVVEDPSLSERK